MMPPSTHSKVPIWGQRRAWNIPEPTTYDLHDLGPVGWFLSSKLPAVPISQLISRYLQILKV